MIQPHPATYRPLGPEDAEAWHDLRLIGMRDFPLGFLLDLSEVSDTTLEESRRILSGGTYRGVFLDGDLIGFCAYSPYLQTRLNHRAQLGPFFVAKPHQGSDAANTLMHGVIAEARAAGIAQLELAVDTVNHRAIAFYERHGFEWMATIRDSLRLDDVFYDDHLYRLRLT